MMTLSAISEAFERLNGGLFSHLCVHDSSELQLFPFFHFSHFRDGGFLGVLVWRGKLVKQTDPMKFKK
jgi:hypothetical protein